MKGHLVNFNTSFFGLYENVYLVLRETHTEQQALALFKQIMEKGLKKLMMLSILARVMLMILGKLLLLGIILLGCL